MSRFNGRGTWLWVAVLLAVCGPLCAWAGDDSGAAHKYLGYSTLAAGGLAAVTGADEEGHKALGVGAAVLGTATLLTGLIEHLGWLDLGDGLDDHDVHILLGGLAAAGFMGAAALGSSDDISHAGLGSAAVVTVGLSVALLRW